LTGKVATMWEVLDSPKSYLMEFEMTENIK